MVGLLMLSLALSAPASASQAVAVANGRDLSQPVSIGQDSPMTVQSAESFDPIAIQPDSEICYKIRSYIFSTGSNPKLLRETTCGPKRPITKKKDGGQPKLVPLLGGDKSAEPAQK
jgi:hypothetical protein